jgi:hypothetical protein
MFNQRPKLKEFNEGLIYFADEDNLEKYHETIQQIDVTIKKYKKGRLREVVSKRAEANVLEFVRELGACTCSLEEFQTSYRNKFNEECLGRDQLLRISRLNGDPFLIYRQMYTPRGQKPRMTRVVVIK